MSEVSHLIYELLMVMLVLTVGAKGQSFTAEQRHMDAMPFP